MNRSFLKYIGCAFAVLAGVTVVDKVAGAGMDRLLDAVPVSQDIGKGHFAINDVSTDIVIVGSSRAAHHYVSTMIADSLGCSVYNVGRDGCFFSDNLCVANAILDRYSPKKIVLEVANDCLDEGVKTSVEGMFPYYWKYDYIKNVIDTEIGWQAPIQLSSKLYAYNGNSFKLIGYGLKGLLCGRTADPLKGYAPLPYVEKRVPLELKESEVSGAHIISDLKCKQLKNLLEKANKKGVEMILICSPVFKKTMGNSESKEVLKKLCEEAGAEYYDYSSEQIFLDHPEWFKDGTHMNNKGALVYTRMVIRELLKD